MKFMSVFALVAFFAVISGTQITSANFYSDVCSRYKKLYSNFLYYFNLTAFDKDGMEQYEDELKNQLANGNISLLCFIY